MKRIFIVFIVLFSFFGVKTKAQQVVCTTETIKLRAKNHQYGILEWEKSTDNINWVKIHNQNDSVYTFKPNETAYYRTVNKFPYCDPIISSTTLVQTIPNTNAGQDRLVNDSYMFLAGNNEVGSTGLWTILEGSNGIISEPTNPNSKFAGSGTYKLLWTLTNSCGSKSDTLKVNFVTNQYYDKIAIVDDTDTILSTASELQNGNYTIQFADPVPSIEVGTLLIGTIGNGFLRKVKSFTQDSSKFTMVTEQGKIDELITSGGLDFNALLSVDKQFTVKQINDKILDRKPTRAELLNDPKFKSGVHYFVIDEKITSKIKGATMKVKKTGLTSKTTGEGEDPVFEFDLTGGEIFNADGLTGTIDGKMTFKPEFFAYYNKSVLKPEFKMGLNNSTLNTNYTFTLHGEANTTLYDREFELFTYNKLVYFTIGAVPVLINAEIDFTGKTTATTNASLTFTHSFNNTITTNAGIEYKNGNWSNYYSDKVENEFTNNFDVTAGLSQNFEIGPDISLKLYDIIGPYLEAKLTEDLNINANTNSLSHLNWNGTLDLGARFTLGASMDWFGSDPLFDYSKPWENRKLYSIEFPYSMEINSGNQQQYTSGTALPKPVKVRVMSNKGFSMPGVFVLFEPFDGNGTVSESYVLTDLSGYAETTWTPTGAGSSKLKAIVLDAEGNNIQYSPLIFEATETTVLDCSHTTLYASYIKNGNQLTPVAHMGVPPYTYSIDMANYTATTPTITMATGGNYQIAIKDANGCQAFVHYYNGAIDCKKSDLKIDVTTYGNNVTVTASGGNLPYQFAVDNGSFGTETTFSGLSKNKHTIKVKDANNCVRTTTIDLTTSTNDLVAYFEIPQTINANQAVTFTNLSTNATSYSWDFGNGQTSTATNASTTYIYNGTYTVTLTAYNGTINSSFSRKILITDGIETLTDVDNNVYPVVSIGTQKWMGENLRVSKYNDGTAITLVNSMIDWEANTNAKYANMPTILSLAYGFSYNWNAVNSNKLCPSGWKVPSYADWQMLIAYLEQEGYLNQNISDGAGNSIKSCYQVSSPDNSCNKSTHPRWNSSTNHGFNQYLFTAFPAGMMNLAGQYVSYGQYGYWWTQEEYDATRGIIISTPYNAGNININTGNKNYGLSVRCIKE